MQYNEEIKEIIKAIENFSAFGLSREVVFRDWCECMALSFANSTALISDLWEKREKRYQEIIKKHKSYAEEFPKMAVHLVNAFEMEPFNDHLGKLYMELFGGNKSLGQCFTPIGVCEICASCVNVQEIKDHPDKVFTIVDECCGGGAMLIAACKVLFNNGINYQRRVRFFGADLDSLCVWMCYVQLSLLGCRAEVRCQNTITMKCFDRFVTPFEMAMFPFTPCNTAA